MHGSAKTLRTVPVMPSFDLAIDGHGRLLVSLYTTPAMPVSILVLM
jgi:hypothetical protein